MTGPRKGRRQLAVLARDLSERDRLVVQSVRQLRLMSARQLERLHFPVPMAHATPLTAARSARRTLERLARDRLLIRLARRIGGVRAGSAAYVYGLGPLGQRVLGDDGVRRRFREPSALFVDHTLAISELYVRLNEAVRAGGIRALEVSPEPGCWRQMAGLGGTTVLKPDLFIVAHDEAFEYRWFVEVDLGTEHGPAVQRKCRAYESYYRAGVEQAGHGVFPRVLWVTADEDRTAVVRRIIEQSSGLTPGLFLVSSTVDAVRVLSRGGT